MANKYDVFISYNWKDSKFVDSLTEFFSMNSIKSFLDRSDLQVYDKLDSRLKQNVIKSKYLISMISRNYLNSYWCLFEAIEAIQTQEFKLKFLPVLLRYSPEDPSLDEDLVLEIMENLGLEIETFEKRLIKNRAFELASKLEKLNFIRNNLPKVFQQIQRNIYPIFDLWNRDSTEENLQKLVRFIAPKSVPDISTFNFVQNDDEGLTLPKFTTPIISDLPIIRWSCYVGKQKRTNTPLIVGNNIYVGSAGREWNKGDNEDGVYCVNGNNGLVRWFYPTYSDVNELSYSDGIILGGCDDGKCFSISARDGRPKWEIDLGSAITSKPLKDTDFIPDFEGFVVPTANGRIYVLDLLNGQVKDQYQIEGEIVSNCCFAELQRKKFLFVPTIQGSIVILEKQIGGAYTIFGSYEIVYPDHYSKIGHSTSELSSKPLIVNGILFQAFARQTYYDYPAVLAIDLAGGQIKWFANDEDGLVGSFGNLRTDLLFDNDEIIFITPYSNELIGLNAETGTVKWTTELGRPIFQQWSSPIVHKNSYYVARHDGYFYKVDKDTHLRKWGIYLGEHTDAGDVFNSDQKQVNEDDRTTWDLYKGFPLLATPQPLGPDLVVSSDEGFLYRIGNV